MPFNNLNEVLDKNARDYPDKAFVKYVPESGGDADILTYKEFQDKVLRLANVFLGMGAKKGDFIALQLGNSIEFCVSIYACYRIGAVATPIIRLWKAREIAEAISKAKMKIMILPSSSTAVVKKSAKTEPMENIILVGDDAYDLPQVKGEFWSLINAADAGDPGIEVKPEDLASCHFTSGTTGQSKGVLHDHEGYLFAGESHSELFGMSPGDYSNLILPMYHIFGFAQLSLTVYAGCTIRMLDKFNPQYLLKALEDPDMTIFAAVPSIYNMIITQDNVEEFTVSPKNRVFVSGAGPLSPKTEDALNKRLLRGHGSVWQCYGSTEDICVGCGNMKGILGSIGTPMPQALIEIVDDEGNILPPGEENVGEIVNQGPHIMLGYLGDPEADDIVDHELTDPVLRPIKGREGIWYWSGDMAWKDEDGNIYITDRSKDIAKVSERLVYPSEVEAVLIEHPGVKEIAVVGVPHETYGEQLLAVVIPTDTSADQAALEAELKALAEKELAHYKVPRVWWFKNAMQTNALGKVLKKEYREQYKKLAARGKV